MSFVIMFYSVDLVLLFKDNRVMKIKLVVPITISLSTVISLIFFSSRRTFVLTVLVREIEYMSLRRILVNVYFKLIRVRLVSLSFLLFFILIYASSISG